MSAFSYVVIVHHRTIGLSTDAALLKGLLERHGLPAVIVAASEAVLLTSDGVAQVAAAVRKEHSVKPVFTVSLEHVHDPFPEAPLVLVPNPEWFNARDAHKAGSRVSTFWHKTAVSERLFKRAFPQAMHQRVGWTSTPVPVTAAASGPDYNLCLHVKGASEQKQTEVLLRTWRPHWPVLHIVTYLDVPGFVALPWPVSHKNILIHYRKLPAGELQNLQRACGVHICCSDAEGFGHYINESRAVGALTITTAHPPMDELVDDSCGILVPPAEFRPHRAAVLPGVERAIVDESGLVWAMERLVQMSRDERRQKGRRGFERFEEERAAFLAQTLRVSTAKQTPAGADTQQ